MNTLTTSFSTAFDLVTSGDAVLWSVVGRSLWVSGCASVLALPLALVAGALLACAQFRLKPLINVVLQAFLAMPSVVLGLLVYVLLSRSGPLGHLGWLFSIKAMVMAQTLLVLPMMMALTRQALEDSGNDTQEQLESIGAGLGWRAAILAWDHREALVLVWVIGFSRAIAEVGAVMVVGGNIEGFTRVMTTAIALETSKGDLPLALGLGLVLLTVVLLLNALVVAVRAWTQQKQGTLAGPLRLERRVYDPAA
jgi:tungstate transport system permease protein